MARSRIRIPQQVVQKYLNEREGSGVRILEYKELGSGWHGTGYKIKFQTKSAKRKTDVKEIVIRTLMPQGFSHDFISDRAKVFILQHEISNSIPSHIASYDVCGHSKNGRLISLGDADEFFQAVEVAYGETYSKDFQRIKETGSLLPSDRGKAQQLALYLKKIHKTKFKGTSDAARSIARRHSRDAIGHGEMMVGVVDTYPDGYKFISKDKMTEFICMAAKFREKIKDVKYAPCRIHGDFHPANIIFNGKKMTVLDSSRFEWGDPADDVIAMGMNYIWFAVMQTGKFSGPFSELFRIFWRTYFYGGANKHILRTAGVHMAFRGVVVAHPFFYSAQTDETRRTMINLVTNVLKAPYFDHKKIELYIRK